MTTVIVRVNFQTPAADPGNGRMRGGWGTTPRIRFMRAQLYAARICEFVEAIFRAPRTLFIHREPGVLQDALGDVAKKFKSPFVAVVVHARTKAWSSTDDVQRNSETGA